MAAASSAAPPLPHPPAGCWSELLPVLASILLGVPTPLSPFLFIYISCVTDVCGGVALVYEGPEGAAMQARSTMEGWKETATVRSPPCSWCRAGHATTARHASST